MGTATSEAVAEHEPNRAVVAQDPAHLPEHLDERADVGLRGRFEAQLPGGPVVAQRPVGRTGHHAVHRAVGQVAQAFAAIADENTCRHTPRPPMNRP